MIKVLICEDDEHSAGINQKYIQKIEEKHSYGLSVIGIAKNSHDVMKYLNQDNIDILLLDIDLEVQGEGVEISKEVKRVSPSVYIIFITGHIQYAPEVFKAGFDYLLKPIDYNKLESALMDVMADMLEKKRRESKYITVTSNFTHIRIPVKDIFYICKEGRKVNIYLSNNEIISTYHKIQEIFEMLKEDFIRISKTQFANLKQIKSYEFSTGKVEFFCSSLLAYASKRYKDAVKKLIMSKE